MCTPKSPEPRGIITSLAVKWVRLMVSTCVCPGLDQYMTGAGTPSTAQASSVVRLIQDSEVFGKVLISGGSVESMINIYYFLIALSSRWAFPVALWRTTVSTLSKLVSSHNHLHWTETPTAAWRLSSDQESYRGPQSICAGHCAGRVSVDTSRTDTRSSIGRVAVDAQSICRWTSISIDISTDTRPATYRRTIGRHADRVSVGLSTEAPMRYMIRDFFTQPLTLNRHESTCAGRAAGSAARWTLIKPGIFLRHALDLNRLILGKSWDCLPVLQPRNVRHWTPGGVTKQQQGVCLVDGCVLRLCDNLRRH